MKTKVIRWKETTKIVTEINKIDNKKTVSKLNKTKS